VVLALLAHIIIIFLFEQERIEARSEASFSQKKISSFFEQKGLKQDFIFSYFFFPPL
tara:strand:- start:89 stop:259 length:171 start_codon:yes stop_codon:yes gene_type:complete